MAALTDIYNISFIDPTSAVTIALGMQNYIHEKSDGFGIPPVEHFLEHSPAQHGATYRGFRLQPRRLTFQLALRAASAQDFYSRRASLISVLRPNLYNLPGYLQFTLPDSSIWRLSVYCSELNFLPPNGLVQSAVFTLVAPDPVYTRYISATLTQFLQVDIGSSKTITYTGTWPVFPYPFTIRGPLEHPVITNLNTAKKLDLDYIVPDNQVVTFDLRAAYKTVKLGSTSLLGYLSADSNLDDFTLYPAPELAGGANVISVNGSNAGDNTRISISFTPVRLAL